MFIHRNIIVKTIQLSNILIRYLPMVQQFRYDFLRTPGDGCPYGDPGSDILSVLGADSDEICTGLTIVITVDTIWFSVWKFQIIPSIPL